MSKSTYVEVNGKEVHGVKKWAVICGAILALVALYAVFSAPAWLMALLV